MKKRRPKQIDELRTEYDIRELLKELCAGSTRNDFVRVQISFV